MPKAPPPYPAEFREEAVRLAKSSGKCTAEIATDFGISYETLHTWLTQDQVGGGNAPGLTTNEREELRKLRRENSISRGRSPAGEGEGTGRAASSRNARAYTRT